MNDQERQIISDIFKRLEQTAAQARDVEAERFIAEKVRTQPYAPYAMAQSLYVQEEAMKSLNAQLEELKAENQRLHQQGQQGSGGFLSSIFGGGQNRPAPGAAFGRPAPQQSYSNQQAGPWGQSAPQQGGPWAGQQGGYAQPQPQAAGGGGFLRGALTTAAGVAGGMVVGNALMNAFSGGHHQTLGGFSQTDMTSLGGGDSASIFGASDGSFPSADSGVSNAGFDQGGFDQGGVQDASFDPGSDFGGGSSDDSSWT